jgi:polyferredoxin
MKRFPRDRDGRFSEGAIWLALIVLAIIGPYSWLEPSMPSWLVPVLDKVMPFILWIIGVAVITAATGLAIYIWNRRKNP